MDNDQTTTSAKRRKLDHATKVLSRPFTTPLKHKTVKHEAEHAVAPQSGALLSACASKATIVGDRAGPASDPVDPAVQHQILQVSKQIRAIRSDIDTLERAKAIHETQNDEHLRRMIKKWRKAAQEAADELFPSVKERVNGMGGARAWRQSEINKHSYGNDDYKLSGTQPHDSFYDVASTNGTTRQHDQQTPSSNKDILSSEATLGIDEDGDERLYDMNMMLRSLNIDPMVIGYNIATQTWLDNDKRA